MSVTFEWRKSGNEVHGYTITPSGRETQIFQIFERRGRYRLARGVAGAGGVEDFYSVRAAKAWAESLLTSDCVKAAQ